MTQAAFYQFPKELFKKPLTCEAKIILIELIDKVKLSSRPENKKAFSSNGEPFARVSRQTIAGWISKSLPTVRKAINELVAAGLIIQKRLGLTKCNIYFLAESVKRLVFSTERKASCLPDKNQIPANKNNPKNNNFTSLTPPPRTQKPSKRLLNAQNYEQRVYTRDQLMSLVMPL